MYKKENAHKMHKKAGHYVPFIKLFPKLKLNPPKAPAKEFS